MDGVGRQRLVAVAVGLAALLVTAPLPSAAQEPRTVVTGTVTDAATGAPAEGVTVVGEHVNRPNPPASPPPPREAEPPPAAPPACGCPHPPPPGPADPMPGIGPPTEEFDRTVTDATGTYRLEGPGPRDDGWTTEVRTIDETDRPFRFLRDHVVAPLDPDGQAAADIALVRSGAVRGRATDAQTREPIDGLVVSILGYETLTAADGSYELVDLRPGAYRVLFGSIYSTSDDTVPDRDYLGRYFGGTTDPAEAQEVEVRAGVATADIDAALIPGATVTGTVVGADGEPLDGIFARVVRTDATTTTRTGPTIFTDERGEWRADGLAAGAYHVLFDRSPWGGIADVAPAGYTPTWLGGGAVRKESEVVVLEAGEVTRAGPTRVVPAGGIRGRIVERTSDVPVGDVCITVVDESGRRVRQEVIEPHTSGWRGFYSISELPPGRYRVLFETLGCGRGAEDQPSHQPRWYGDVGTFDAATTITVPSGEVLDGIDGVLDPNPPPSLSAGVVDQVGRIAGADRIATAAELALRSFAGETPDAVVLARADDYADALAGGPLAARLGAPLLLTGGEGLDPRTGAAVTELGAGTAYLLGGELALTPQVEADLRAAGITDVVRVAGADRFDTAARIAKRLTRDPVDGEPDLHAVGYLAEGINEDPARGWPDALAASAGGRGPVLLTARDALPEATRAVLGRFTRMIIVGGDTAVSPEVAGDVQREVLEVNRVWGATRYETARRLLRERTDRPWFVSGGDWPDALTAGAAVRLDGGNLLLVDGTAPPAPEDLAAFGESLPNLERVLLVGGPAAITPAYEDTVRARVPPGVSAPVRGERRSPG